MLLSFTHVGLQNILCHRFVYECSVCLSLFSCLPQSEEFCSFFFFFLPNWFPKRKHVEEGVNEPARQNRTINLVLLFRVIRSVICRSKSNVGSEWLFTELWLLPFSSVIPPQEKKKTQKTKQNKKNLVWKQLIWVEVKCRPPLTWQKAVVTAALL